MNRNVESHFSLLPSADISRSRFDRSQDIKFTFNVGDLIPFYVDEVLPGDTFDITTSKVVRMQTLLTPVMDNIYLDTYWFFVPNRLVWTHWRNLMGENTASAWLPEATYSVPVIKLQNVSTDYPTGDSEVKTGDIADYMGIPVGVSAGSTATANIPEFNALPLRAYQLIFNEWFRSENLTDPVNIQTGDTNYKYATSSVPKKPYKAAKYHDYFTSCLPAPLKADPVRAPVTTGGVAYTLLVYAFNKSHDVLNSPAATLGVVGLRGVYQNTTESGYGNVYASLRNQNGIDPTDTYEGAEYRVGTETTFLQSGFTPDNLYAWMYSTGASDSTFRLGIDINELRYAFQLQKLYERDARGGLINRISGLRVKKIEEKNWKAA